MASKKVAAVRLATDYIPTHYSLYIHPYIPEKMFLGYVAIDFKNNNPESREIQLHADQTLIIQSVIYKGYSLNFRRDGCVLYIEVVEPPTESVTITYTGSLNHKAVGLFYVDDDSCVSQFEPADARKALPCFDEPAVKATFSVRFETKSDLTVLSNMPAKSVMPTTETGKLTEFETTPPMCTYLLAFAVGKYDKVTGNSKRGIPIDVYASQGNLEYLDFPLDEAIKAVDWIEDFYGINYDLPRLQILGSKRFMCGGMENYGLIIIVESLLIKNDGRSSTAAPRTALDLQFGQMLASGDMWSQMQSLLNSPGMAQTVRSMMASMGFDSEIVDDSLQLVSSANFSRAFSSSAHTHIEGISATEQSIINMLSDPALMEEMAQLMRRKSLSQLVSMMDDTSMNMVMMMVSTASGKQMSAQVVAHEIVHMWAGNMVSPQWWDSLWLNEGFATLLPTLMFDEYHSDYMFLKLYDAGTNQLAVTLDSFDTTRPIHGDVVEERDPFDLMSYNKAGIVLGMLRRIVGPDAFKEAVRKFTRDFYHKNADTADIMRSFSESFGKDMKPFFDAWIYKSGFPLVILEDNTVRQISFLGEEERIWPIPLKMRYGKDGKVEERDIILDVEMMEIDVDADWIILNPGLESFCRVWAVSDRFYSAVEAVNQGVLTPYEKTHWTADQMMLYRRGFIDEEDISYMCSVLGMQLPA